MSLFRKGSIISGSLGYTFNYYQEEPVHNEKEKMEDRQNEKQHDEKKDPVFQIEEVTIEEMAIDGICGVY